MAHFRRCNTIDMGFKKNDIFFRLQPPTSHFSSRRSRGHESLAEASNWLYSVWYVVSSCGALDFLSLLFSIDRHKLLGNPENWSLPNRSQEKRNKLELLAHAVCVHTYCGNEARLQGLASSHPTTHEQSSQQMNPTLHSADCSASADICPSTWPFFTASSTYHITSQQH